MTRELDTEHFDCLVGEAGPTELFGHPLQGADLKVALGRFSEHVGTVAALVADGFGIDPSDHATIASQLDAVVREMWGGGWSPDTGDVDLFVSHFGSLLARALLNLPGAEATFRSPVTLDHHSAWFAATAHEFFPFHKVLKALSRREGESIDQFYRAAAVAASVS
jgi:hypothetical protein